MTRQAGTRLILHVSVLVTDMIGKTVVDFIGHIIFSFTRSVAEHYDFDEAELDLELFGYNPLDDTGKEWYYQPVDELIYQEYSDRDGTKFDYLPSSRIQARFLNACSTEETEETADTGSDRAMAWKRFRPSFVGTVCKSAYLGFLVSVLSAVIVGIVSILLYYLSFQTQLNCLVRPEKLIPKKYSGSKLSPQPPLSSFSTVGFSSIAYFIFGHFKYQGKN